MKKYIVFLCIVLGLFSGVTTTSWATMEKNIIAKKLILSKVDLVKNSPNGKNYIVALDAFFEKYPADSVKIQDMLKRIPGIRSKLWSSAQHKEILRIINYIEYKAAYLSITLPTTPPEEPKLPTGQELENTQTIAQIKTLASKIEIYITENGTTSFQDIIGVELSNRTSTGSQWVIWYPNYANLEIKKEDYQDSLEDEYIIVYHIISDSINTDQYYYQILGYTQTAIKEKTAVVWWNYHQIDSTYPVSLFVDSQSKNAILDGDVFSID